MKKIFLLTVIAFGSFALFGCGETTTNNGTATKSEEPAKSTLKPGDVSPDKPVLPKDLAEAAKADKTAWQGKEVAVKGYIMGTSGSGGKFGYSLTLKNEQKASSSEDLVSCKVPEGDLPKGLLSKTVEIKGTVKDITDTGIVVRLDPCQLTKQE
jgi:hypothetical protein